MMHTARLLTASPSMHCPGEVSAQGVSAWGVPMRVPAQEECLPIGGGFCLGGVCPGGCTM